MYLKEGYHDTFEVIFLKMLGQILKNLIQAGIWSKLFKNKNSNKNTRLTSLRNTFCPFYCVPEHGSMSPWAPDFCAISPTVVTAEENMAVMKALKYLE
jgi:hypothetical protein